MVVEAYEMSRVGSAIIANMIREVMVLQPAITSVEEVGETNSDTGAGYAVEVGINGKEKIYLTNDKSAASFLYHAMAIED